MNHYQQQQQQMRENMQMQQQVGSGLTRYRSAPSSYLTNILDSTSSSGGFGGDDFDQIFNTRASSPERQQIFPRFMNSVDTLGRNYSSNVSLQSRSQFVPPIKNETEVHQTQQQLQRQQSNDYSSVSQMMYQSHNSGDASSAMDNLFSRLNGSINSNCVAHTSMDGGGGNSNLIRQSSLPAGLFANMNFDNDFGAMRSLGNFAAGNSASAEALSSSASRFKNQMVFPSMNHSSGMMTPIAEIGSKSFGETHPGDGHFQEDHDDDYITGFPVVSWNDSSILSDDFVKGLGDDDTKTFSNINALDDQNSEGGNSHTTQLSHHLSLPSSSSTQLAHHLSLPSSSSKTSAMEKMLQDSVPCKIRAKRGCATHPRSIAERVRRTRISERMRKLQELVPNMERQTNTSDMLDLAVDYIKDLQTQVKISVQSALARLNRNHRQKAPRCRNSSRNNKRSLKQKSTQFSPAHISIDVVRTAF